MDTLGDLLLRVGTILRPHWVHGMLSRAASHVLGPAKGTHNVFSYNYDYRVPNDHSTSTPPQPFDPCMPHLYLPLVRRMSRRHHLKDGNSQLTNCENVGGTAKDKNGPEGVPLMGVSPVPPKVG